MTKEEKFKKIIVSAFELLEGIADSGAMLEEEEEEFDLLQAQYYAIIKNEKEK